MCFIHFIIFLHIYEPDKNEYSCFMKLIQKIELQPCSPVRRILNEAHVFKELVGQHIVLFYVAEHRVTLSMEFLGQSADHDFGIAFPSVLWQRVKHSYSA